VSATLENLDADRLYRKVTTRILPFLFICYTVAFLDRINLGIGQVEMKQDLGFSDLALGFGASIFFIGYIITEIPSNLLITRVGVRLTFCRIMILWGLTAAAMALVTRPFHLYAVRFLLGVFEAGLYPGIIYYITRWYPLDRRARIVGLFTCAIGVAGLIGGPISGALMTFLNGTLGLFGWQWMFIAEGLPACVLGVVTLFYLQNEPTEARWLTPAERQRIAADVAASNAVGPRGEHTVKRALTDWRLYVFGIIGLGQICPLYAIGFWMPTTIKGTGITSPLWIGVISAIPYFCSWIALIVVSRSSDRTLERRWHLVGTLLAAGGGLILVGLFSTNVWISMIGFSISMSGILAAAPVCWAINTGYMRGRGSAAGIALLNTLGLIGGIISPTIMGWTKTLTGSLTTGLFVMGSVSFVAAVVAITLVPGMLTYTPPRTVRDLIRA
jgi:MFS family permease